ncbi:MAG: DEAD/DEAH box helicase, partial [Clostridiales bacterium]|nr:DEAD/DEAH box helicase [Clostridiales bacterium]
MERTRFTDLQVSPEILQAIDSLGLTELTEIQEKTIPEMMSGRDVIGKAPTGTGKTFAFGVPIIEGLDVESASIQALIMAPTRELCLQICDDMKSLSRFMPKIRILAAYGGQPINKQLTALSRKPQIVVATPGRLL